MPDSAKKTQHVPITNFFTSKAKKPKNSKKTTTTTTQATSKKTKKANNEESPLRAAAAAEKKKMSMTKNSTTSSLSKSSDSDKENGASTTTCASTAADAPPAPPTSNKISTPILSRKKKEETPQKKKKKAELPLKKSSSKKSSTMMSSTAHPFSSPPLPDRLPPGLGFHNKNKKKDDMKELSTPLSTTTKSEILDLTVARSLTKIGYEETPTVIAINDDDDDDEDDDDDDKHEIKAKGKLQEHFDSCIVGSSSTTTSDSQSLQQQQTQKQRQPQDTTTTNNNNKKKTEEMSQEDITRKNLFKLYNPKMKTLLTEVEKIYTSQEDFSSLDPLPTATATAAPSNDNNCDDDIVSFPEKYVPCLAAFIQGSTLPLSELVSTFSSKKLPEEIKKKAHHQDDDSNTTFHETTIASKIKLIAKRIPFYADNINNKANNNNTGDIYEDIGSSSTFWRWDLITPEMFLPDSYCKVISEYAKKRRKVISHFKALKKLLDALQQQQPLVMNGDHQQSSKNASSKNVPPSLDVIQKREEAVLKFEREIERKKALEQKKATKKLEQQKKKEEREKELQRKKKEKEREVQEKKLQKEKEEEQKKRLEKEKKEKQKKRMLSFFTAPKSKKHADFSCTSATSSRSKTGTFFSSSGKNQNLKMKNSKSSSLPCLTSPKLNSMMETRVKDFESDKFQREINTLTSDTSLLSSSNNPFHDSKSLSNCAVQSRKRKTKNVDVSVVVTTVDEESVQQKNQDPNNTFHFGFDGVGGGMAFSERKTISVPNKLKFLAFYEDRRPAYRGTWRKKSNLVTGKTPFRKDTTYLDYDFDSEEEWEEEEEDGEDLDMGDEDDPVEDEEGEDLREYNYQDNWLMQDDEVMIDKEKEIHTDGINNNNDDDEEEDDKIHTKQLSQKNQNKDSLFSFGKICVSPKMGGLVPDESDLKIVGSSGMNFRKSKKLWENLQGRILSRNNYDSTSKTTCIIDLYPIEDQIRLTTPKTTLSAQKKEETEKVSPETWSDELMAEFCKLVHNCDLASKDKIVEEIRTKSSDSFGSFSRALLTRKLDSISQKKKLGKGLGVVWHVKENILREVRLQDLISQKHPNEIKLMEIMKQQDLKQQQQQQQQKQLSSESTLSSPKAKKLSTPKKCETKTKTTSTPTGHDQQNTKNSISRKRKEVLESSNNNNNKNKNNVITNFLTPRKKPKSKA